MWALTSPNLTITYDNESISTYVFSRLQTIPKEIAEKKLCSKIAGLCASKTLRCVYVLQDDQEEVEGTFAAELQVSVRAKDWKNNYLRPYCGGTTKLNQDLPDGLLVSLVEGSYVDGLIIYWVRTLRFPLAPTAGLHRPFIASGSCQELRRKAKK